MLRIINFSGYGLIIVVIDYFGGLVLLSKLSPLFFQTKKQQYIALVLFHILITGFNFLLSRYLNRKEVKHTVYGLRLEKVILFVGFILLPILVLMGKDIVF